MATKSTHGYCDACGMRVDWQTGNCVNATCAVNTVDWEKRPMEPGPVRFPTREEAMADSRRAMLGTGIRLTSPASLSPRDT